MSAEDKPQPQFRLTRPSASAEAAQAAEQARLGAMTVRERMALALRLGARMRGLKERFAQGRREGTAAR